MHPHSYKEVVVHLCRPNRTLHSAEGDPIKQVQSMPQAAQTHPECPGNPQCLNPVLCYRKHKVRESTYGDDAVCLTQGILPAYKSVF